MKKKYTIKDIAKLAGVSKGTVDRVIHNRGKVSEKSLLEINKVLAQIDYKPNLIARNLKNTKTYNICILLPDNKIDSYWEASQEGIEMAKTEFASFDVIISTFLYDPRDVKSLIIKSEEILEIKPDAVLLTPLFLKESKKIIEKLNANEIIVSIFNNNIDHVDVSNFVGQDLIKSGRIAAKLFDLILSTGKIAIIHIEESFENASYIQSKEKGFKEYLSQNNSTLETITGAFNTENLEKNISEFLEENKSIKGIFVTNSKAYKIAKIVESLQITDLKIIGYDLLQDNIDYLKNNTIQFLIHQNPKHQTFLGLSNLIEFFLFSKEIPKNNLLPINIINSENLDSYIQKEAVYE